MLKIQESLPRIGCASIVRKGELYLLGERNKEPNRGMIIFPGGRVEPFEKMIVALRRETLEETGARIKWIEFLDHYEIINPPTEHRIVAYYLAEYAGGSIRGGGDLKDPRFYDRAEINELIRKRKLSPITVKVINDIGWLRR